LGIFGRLSIMLQTWSYFRETCCLKAMLNRKKGNVSVSVAPLLPCYNQPHITNPVLQSNHVLSCHQTLSNLSLNVSPTFKCLQLQNFDAKDACSPRSLIWWSLYNKRYDVYVGRNMNLGHTMISAKTYQPSTVHSLWNFENPTFTQF
jgi:hypothetical protein